MQDKYIRGYKSSLDKETLLFFNKKFSQSSLIMGTGYLFTIHISIFLSIYIYISWLNSNLLCLPILLFFLARQLRALENIIHFGSHYNFTKNQANSAEQAIKAFHDFSISQSYDVSSIFCHDLLEKE